MNIELFTSSTHVEPGDRCTIRTIFSEKCQHYCCRKKWQAFDGKGSFGQHSITDADFADDIVILANTPNQAETLLHSLERAAAGIGLHVNAHKTECMY